MRRHLRYLIAGVVLVALSFGITAHANAATHNRAPVVAKELPPVGPFPDAECNEDAAMDIYVGPDGALWECVCQKTFSGHDCAWYEVPETEAAKFRRKARARLHLRILPRLVAIHYA